MRKLMVAAALAAALAVAMGGSAGFAGPMSDAETALRGAYGHYRWALFATNTGKPDKATAELAAFQAAWTALGPQLAAAPQYADDSLVPGTFAKVAELASAASEAVTAGDMEKAHETLEGIRGEIAGLHDRNGLIGFSDRMNAYHATMETVLGMTPDQIAADGGMEALAESTAVLAYLAGDIAAHPASDSADVGYAPLGTAFQASVKALVDAVHSGDAAALSKAMGELKPAYSKFFVAFG